MQLRRGAMADPTAATEREHTSVKTLPPAIGCSGEREHLGRDHPQLAARDRCPLSPRRQPGDTSLAHSDGTVLGIGHPNQRSEHVCPHAFRGCIRWPRSEGQPRSHRGETRTRLARRLRRNVLDGRVSAGCRGRRRRRRPRRRAPGVAASPSGTNESAAATRRIGPVNPASTSAATTASPTPPVCRVSSTTSTRPTARGVGARSRRPAAAPASAGRGPGSRCPRRPGARRLAATRKQTVGPRHDEHVVALANEARLADRHVLVRPRRGGAYGAVQPSSPGSCRSRVW